MKNAIKIFSLFIGTFLMFPVFGQEFSVTNGQVNYERDTYPAVVVRMEPEAKEVKKAWESFVKDKYDVHMRGIGFLTNKDVLSAEKVLIPKISDKQMDFFTEVVAENDVTTMSVFGSLGYDIPVSMANESTHFTAMRGMVVEFLNGYLPNYYQQKLEEADEMVAATKNEQENLRKSLEDNEKEMAKLREENEKLRKEFDKQQSAFQEANALQSDRRAKLESIKSKLATMENF